MNKQYLDKITESGTEDIFTISIKSQLAAQQYELQVMTETLKTILAVLKQQPHTSEQEKKISIIQQYLIDSNYDSKKNSKSLDDLHSRFSEDSNTIKQDIQRLKNHHNQIHKQLSWQQEKLQELSSVKILALQFLAITLGTSLMTIFLFKLIPPTFRIIDDTSPNSSEVKKEVNSTPNSRKKQK